MSVYMNNRQKWFDHGRLWLCFKAYWDAHLRIFWGVFRICAYYAITAVLVDSSLGFNKAYAPGRVYVCVLRHAESAGDIKESRAHIVPQPWQCGPDLRDGSVFTACPFHSSAPFHLPRSRCGNASCFSAEIHPATWWGWALAFLFESVYMIIKSKPETGCIINLVLACR